MNYLAKYLPPPPRKGVSMIKHIGPSTKHNSLRVIFELQRMTSSQNPCKMKWVTSIRIISTCPMNNSVTSCTPWSLTVIKSEIQLKSKYLRPLIQLCLTLTVMQYLGFHERIISGLISWQPSSINSRRSPIIVVPSVTAYCARRQELLGASGNRIAEKLLWKYFQPGFHQGRTESNTRQQDKLC